MDSGYFYAHKRKTLYYLNEITMRGSHFVPCLVVSSNGLCKFFSISFLYRRYPGLKEEEKNYYSEIAKVVYSFMSVWVCVSDCVRVTNCVCEEDKGSYRASSSTVLHNVWLTGSLADPGARRMPSTISQHTLGILLSPPPHAGISGVLPGPA